MSTCYYWLLATAGYWLLLATGYGWLLATVVMAPAGYWSRSLGLGFGAMLTAAMLDVLLEALGYSHLHCTTIQCIAVLYNTVKCSSVLRSVVQCIAVPYSSLVHV